MQVYTKVLIHLPHRLQLWCLKASQSQIYQLPLKCKVHIKLSPRLIQCKHTTGHFIPLNTWDNLITTPFPHTLHHQSSPTSAASLPVEEQLSTQNLLIIWCIRKWTHSKIFPNYQDKVIPPHHLQPHSLFPLMPPPVVTFPKKHHIVHTLTVSFIPLSNQAPQFTSVKKICSRYWN